MSTPSISELSKPEKRTYDHAHGYSAECEWWFNAANTELGEHGSAWREVVSGTPINTESSDLVLGWGKSLVSSPEKYRRVLRAFRLLPSYTLERLAARYKPITAESAQIEEARNRAEWHSQLGDLQWVALAVAAEMDRREVQREKPARHMVSLLRDVSEQKADKAKQKGSLSWLQKAERASLEAHAEYDRARQYETTPQRDHNWVLTGQLRRPSRLVEAMALPYGSLLTLWDAELHGGTSLPEPRQQRPQRQKVVARTDRDIQIQLGTEWAMAQ